MTQPTTKPNHSPRPLPPRADNRVLLTARGYELAGDSPKFANARSAHLRATYRTNTHR